MIIVGGFNVYPKEVEEVLYTHPKLQLAAVIGLPDPKSGESVKAFVQLKPGQAAQGPFQPFGNRAGRVADKSRGYLEPAYGQGGQNRRVLWLGFCRRLSEFTFRINFQRKKCPRR
jgi:acyl-CoA synthetase (AMP-forming)/AMP-acid ligase II